MSKSRKKKRRYNSITKKRKYTPKSNKFLKFFLTKNKALKKEQSYTPSFYKDITKLHSKSPIKSIIGNSKLLCKDDEIYNSKMKKCYPWSSKIAKNIALKNLNSKKKFDIDDIIGPKQVLANCWLNCFFVIYFISDKGNKFFRYLRRAMIKGVNIEGKPIKKNLQRLLFIFNKFIESIIRGQYSEINKQYALKLDTNVLIKEIYKELPNVNSSFIPNINKGGNVERFYIGLLHYMNFSTKIRKSEIYTISQFEDLKKNKEYINKLYNSHIIVLYIRDDDNDNLLSNNYFKSKKKPKTIRIKNRVFKLDSALLIDNDKEHATAYITVNNKECIFEGYSYSRIVPFKWKNKINKNKNWKTFTSSKIEDNYNNFMKGIQYLYYYRD